jgi:hypothetical protein
VLLKGVLDSELEGWAHEVDAGLGGGFERMIRLVELDIPTSMGLHY